MLRLRDVLLTFSQRRKALEASKSIGHDNGGRGNDYHHAEIQREKLALCGQSLTPGDLERAEGASSAFSSKRFPDEIAVLKDGGSVRQNSNLYKLDPVLQDGWLQVGGRLSRAAMPEVEKHPFFHPSFFPEQHVSKLLLKHIWITHANSACRKVISECVVCHCLQGKTGEQNMADLPTERIVSNLPAERIVSKGRSTAKCK